MSDEPRDTLRGLILDLDGLLIDSEMWSWQAHNEALARLGAAPLTLREIRLLVGLDADGEWAMVSGMRTLPLPRAAYTALHREAYLALRDRLLAPLPGVRELLAQAKLGGLRLAVASNSPLPSITASLVGMGIRERFAAVCSADEVPHGKPAPDVYLLALERLGLRAGQAAAVEDSTYGLAAARAAGLRCLVVPSEITAAQDLDLATERFPSLREVAQWIAGQAVGDS